MINGAETLAFHVSLHENFVCGFLRKSTHCPGLQDKSFQLFSLLQDLGQWGRSKQRTASPACFLEATVLALLTIFVNYPDHYLSASFVCGQFQGSLLLVSFHFQIRVTVRKFIVRYCNFEYNHPDHITRVPTPSSYLLFPWSSGLTEILERTNNCKVNALERSVSYRVFTNL